MIPTTIAFSTAASMACGYRVYKKRQNENFCLNMHIEEFKSQHAEDLRAKQKAVSFDFFNTIVGRDVQFPEDIFKLLESESGVTDFAKIRKDAEKYCKGECLGNIDEIYEHIKKVLPAIDVDSLKKKEWDLEKKHAVLIQSNVNKLLDASTSDQIIIVSDTFYSASHLRELLEHLKFPNLEKIKIFASRSGKKTGWVWTVLSEFYSIVSHTGDDYNTDIRSFQRAFPLLPTYHSQMAHVPTDAELLMERFECLELSQFMRRLSLKNPYAFSEDNKEKYSRYRLQASFAIPVFLFFIHSINKILDGDPEITRVVAISRDCINLEPLLQKFVTVEVRRLCTSRKLLREELKSEAPNKDYQAYMHDILLSTKKVLVIDINGTFMSLSSYCKKFFNGRIPRTHYLSCQAGAPPRFAWPFFSVAIPGVDTNIMERLCVAAEGSLIGWAESREEPFGGPVRLPCEHDDSVLEATQKAYEDLDIVEIPEFIKNVNPKIMCALMQKITNLYSKALTHADDPTNLSGTSYRSNDLRYLELSKLYSRVLTEFCCTPEKTPLRILDFCWPRQGRSTVPWKEYMKKRAEVSLMTSLSEMVSPDFSKWDIVCVTLQNTSEITPYKKLFNKYLGVHLVDDKIVIGVEGLEVAASWNLTPSGKLVIFKPQSDLSDLPSVPSASSPHAAVSSRRVALPASPRIEAMH